MKKKITFLGVALSLMMMVFSGSAFAQFTEVWKVVGGTTPQFAASGDNVRGAALNRATGHYLIASKATAPPKIYVYNAATGVLLDSLNTTGISGGTLTIVDIEVTEDGVVYATNLVTSPAAFKIYRWENDNSTTVPTVAFEGSLLDVNGRYGDAFDVAGTGVNTVIYVGGNNAATDSVMVFTTTDGETFTNSGVRKVTGSQAAVGIAQITPGGNFLATQQGAAALRLYNTTGGIAESVPTSVAPLSVDIAYREAAGRKWIALAESAITANHNRKGVLLNVTYGLAKAVRVGETPVLGTTAATGIGSDIDLQYNDADSTFTIYMLADNNAFGAWKTGNVLLQNLNPLAANFRRTQYVPFNNQPDTVYIDVRDDGYIPKDSVWISYTINGTVNGKVVMSLVSGDSTNGTYRGILAAANNLNGNRIEYYVTVADDRGARVVTATEKYFAGVTPMALSTVRAIDENGVMLYKGFAARFKGVCVQEDSLIAIPTSRHDVIIQDDSGAVDIVEFAVSGVAPPWRMKRGNVYYAAGKVDQYNGKIQIAIPGTGLHIEVIDDGPGVAPKPKEVTIADLSYDNLGEKLENAVVMIHNVWLTPGSLKWPNAGAPGTNITITDNGVDSLTLRVPALSTANGVPPLTQPFTVVGVAGQFDNSSPFTSGYQIIMRQVDDIIPEVPMSITTGSGDVGAEVTLSAVTGMKVDTFNISSYQFNIMFDSTKLQYVSATNNGTISSGFTFAVNQINGAMLRVAASGSTALKDSGALFTFTLKIKNAGEGYVGFNGQYNEGSPYAMPARTMISGSVPFDNPDTVHTITAKVTLDGKLDEPEWANASTLIFGPSDAPKSGNEKTVTGGFDIKASFDVGGVTYHIPYKDTSYTKVKFLQYGSDLYIGIQSPDKSICKFDWEADGIFVQIKNKTGETKEYKLYYQNIDSTANTIRYEESVLNSGAGAGVLAAGSTVNDTTNVDNGFTAELKIKLASLGYADGDKAVPVSMVIFDPDGFQFNSTLPWPYGMSQWDSARGSYYKSWWGSEWGSSFKTIALQPMTGVVEAAQLPTEYALHQNYPNPFNPTTNIRYSILQQGPTTLVIYDLLGREVRTLVNETLNAGTYEKTWDGKNNFGSQVASGIYIYRIQSGSFVSTKKMMLLK